jgi:hypothetical protein
MALSWSSGSTTATKRTIGEGGRVYTDEGDLEIKGDGDCDRNEDYVIDERQPRATFRLDDSESEFKNLSVREIESDTTVEEDTEDEDE